MSITKIAELVKEANSVAVAIHKNPDSDCVGSASALVLALQSMGKTAHIFVDGNIPERLAFLVDNTFFATDRDKDYDVCVAVDVASIYMMGNVKEDIYDKAKVRCCIDHHATNLGYAEYNYVDGSAAAAGEVMYFFIKDHLNCEITPSVATRLYSAIAGDTGSFQYSNTTSQTLVVASNLLAVGIDAPIIMRRLFERKTLKQLKLNADVTKKLKFYSNRKICVAVVDAKMLSKYDMKFEDADDIVSLPRSIEGVEVGVYIKVLDKKECKISLRSNERVDVSSVAKQMGGGGHIRAAGFTIYESAKKAERIIVELLEKLV